MQIVREAFDVKKKKNFYEITTNAVPIRIWMLTDDIVRIRAGFDGDFDEASYSLLMTAWESRTDSLFEGERKRVEAAESELSEDENCYVITGAKLDVKIQKKPFVIRIADKEGNVLHEDIPDLAYRKDGNSRRMHSVSIEETDHFFGFGEQSGHLNKAEESLRLAPGDSMGYNPEKTESLYKHIPFYVRLNEKTHKAVGYFYHNSAECEFNLGRQKRNYWHRYSTYTVDSGDVDLFFIAGPTVKEVISRYTDLTGKSVLLPKAALGYLGSSMYYPELEKDCDEAILGFVDTAKKEEIPMDGFQLSSGYCAIPTEEGIKRCSFTWNKDRFKDPAAWFKAMKDRGIVVSPNVKPGMLLVHPLLSEMEEKEMFVLESEDASQGDTPFAEAKPAVGTWWGGDGYFVDFTKDTTRDHWKEYLKENLLKYGVTSIWNDNCEYDSVVDKDSKVYFEGKTSTIGAQKSVMSSLMCKLAYEAIREYHGNVRPFVVCRSGHAGIQHYAQTWAGDNLTCWEALKYNIATMLGMSASGVSNQGCDVGGFYGPAPSEELFLRWVQMGVFMPRFSIHSVNVDNTVTEPWMYGDITPLIRDAIQLRYQLSPYFYSLMYESTKSGLPMMRPFFMEFECDCDCYDEDVNFMLGESLLVAPVVEEGADTKVVYLPDDGGKFYDFYSGEVFEGGCTLEIDVDEKSIPLFVRSGAIIPVAENEIMNLTNDKVTDLTLIMAPDEDGSFVLYEDDGCSLDYEKGEFKATAISMYTTGRETGSEHTTVSFVSMGDYESTVEVMRLDVFHPGKAPFYVYVDGKEIPHYLYRKDYEEAEQGWYYSQTKKSVEITYPNIKEDYEVELSFEQFDMIGM